MVSLHHVSGFLIASMLGLSLVAGVGVGAPVSETEGWQNETTPAGPERAFVADDSDPLSGSLPPFVLRELADVARSENTSVANVSRIRDFTYSTTEPDVAVGADDQTLREYRRSQLERIKRNNSSSRWLPQSNRSNGTVVKNAHIISANQQRALLIAKDIREYAKQVPAGFAVDSRTIRTALQAKEEQALHTQTIARVMEFLDRLGKEHVRVVKRHGTKRAIFTETAVERLSKVVAASESGTEESAGGITDVGSQSELQVLTGQETHATFDPCDSHIS